jgi:hypothetical protein
VNSSEENRSQGPVFRMSSEDGLSSDHTRIRSALLNLPKVGCPVGFEFRLEQRISGKAGRRVNHSMWNWATGVAAGGLGLAAALSVAVFVFDFTPWEVGGGAAMMANSKIVVPQAQPAPVLPQVATGDASFTGSPERVLASDVPVKDALTAAVKDTTPDGKQRVALPEGHYNTVDGNGR